MAAECSIPAKTMGRQIRETRLHLVRDVDGPEATAKRPPFVDDRAFLAALRAGETTAVAALFDRYHVTVERMLARVLGIDSELADLVHDVFVRAIRGVHSVRDCGLLGPWLRRIAVCTAIDCLRRRRRGRWLHLVPTEELDQPQTTSDSDAREAVRRVYATLDAFPDDERVAFTLRILAGMELVDVAAAAGCSLATIKRRIARSEARFVTVAREDPILRVWLEEGDRWRAQ